MMQAAVNEDADSNNINKCWKTVFCQMILMQMQAQVYLFQQFNGGTVGSSINRNIWYSHTLTLMVVIHMLANKAGADGLAQMQLQLIHSLIP